MTHLNIDRDLGLAKGSTSYYARTRHDLIALIVEHLAVQVLDDLAAPEVPEELTPEVAARLIVAGLNATMRREDEHRARLVLLLECRSDPQLVASLATRPQVRETVVAEAAEMLRRLGIANPDTHARDLAALMDALLMQRLIRTAPIDEGAVVTAYLKGLVV
ncbi:TetR/AcrR family transcriptional regulator [Tessaracoccus caeni]|uniref:TetR/AcrR family transcriptional regulator n=1 Tax=Tessaracoccus caeni TaxID=3031239 RepID=UPI0023DB0308|nr:TetR family transcriptional regulator [Tessaracoccus caeni]MDF1488435.1 TetR family transcriptional regulator [Tessaracoccus caeni]